MQLVMRRPNLGNLPQLALPEGYHLRMATLTDAAALASLLSSSFEDVWTPELAHQRFFEDPSVQRTFVIEYKAEIVATASSQLLPEQWPESGVIHWVGASPAHAGKRLGYLVSAAVLQDHQKTGCKTATLTTDDHRLPAIKTYLNLGFQPLIGHHSHELRWQQVMKQLS